MPVPQSDDGQPDSAERFASEKETVPVDRKMDSAMLEGVLQQTLSLMGSDKPLAAETREALYRLVTHHKGMPFSLEPIAVELVSIVLQSRLSGDPASVEVCNGIAAKVAQTLCEDEPSRNRLEAFWNRLSGG